MLNTKDFTQINHKQRVKAEKTDKSPSRTPPTKPNLFLWIKTYLSSSDKSFTTGGVVVAVGGGDGGPDFNSSIKQLAFVSH